MMLFRYSENIWGPSIYRKDSFFSIRSIWFKYHENRQRLKLRLSWKDIGKWYLLLASTSATFV